MRPWDGAGGAGLLHVLLGGGCFTRAREAARFIHERFPLMSLFPSILRRRGRSGALLALGPSMLAACVAQSADPEAPGASAQAVTVSSPVPPTTDPLAGAPSTFELLVVTDQGYAPQAKPLIDYKNANGTSAFLVTMQGAVQGTSCQLGACADAVRLKLLIQRAYE